VSFNSEHHSTPKLLMINQHASFVPCDNTTAFQV